MPDAFRQLHDQLGLPAQQVPLEIRLVLITRDVAETGQMARLRVHDGVRVGARSHDLLVSV